jgi:hypothetical protein
VGNSALSLEQAFALCVPPGLIHLRVPPVALVAQLVRLPVQVLTIAASARRGLIQMRVERFVIVVKTAPFPHQCLATMGAPTFLRTIHFVLQAVESANLAHMLSPTKTIAAFVRRELTLLLMVCRVVLHARLEHTQFKVQVLA